MRTGTSRPILRHGVAVVAAVLAAALAAVVPSVALAASGDGSGGAGTPPPVTDNEFVPADRDLSDCLSSLPKPDCGSDARGGWRQFLILGLVLAGTAGIGTRIAVAVRRRDAALADQVEDRQHRV